MVTLEKIKPYMKVIDDQGWDVGIVDHLENDMIMLTRDVFGEDLHHFVPVAAILSFDQDCIKVGSSHASTTEQVLTYLRDVREPSPKTPPVFGTSGHGTGEGGSGFGG